MNRSAGIWIIIAVLTVAGAVVAAGAVKDTRERVLRVEREACRTERSCQALLNRLLRFASKEQKKAIVESLPNIRERLKRQIRKNGQPSPVVPPRSAPAPAAPVNPQPEPVPGPRGPQGPPGPPAKPPPVEVVPDPPEPVPEPEPPPLPPLPEPVCEVLPVLCPDPNQTE